MNLKEELDDIFGTPIDGSNIDDDASDESQEGAYAAVIGSSEDLTFEDKAQAVNSKLRDVLNAEGIDVAETDESHEEVEDEISTSTSTSQQGDSHEQSSTSLGSVISSAKNATERESEPFANDKMGVNELASDRVAESESEKPVESDSVKEDGDSSMSDNLDDLRQQGFVVDAPTKTYESFYSMKIDAIRRHLPKGKKLPLRDYMREMRDAFVSIKIGLTDLGEIQSKMQAIQQKRDRVVQLKTAINFQYYPWKRLIVMLHGQLARVIYEKPAAKQEGVNYEHMRDLEEYFNELEGAYETSKDILANLDAAYDNLSRQVTIALPKPSREVREDRSSDMSEFDSLPQNTQVKPQSQSGSKPKKDISGPAEIGWAS